MKTLAPLAFCVTYVLVHFLLGCGAPAEKTDRCISDSFSIQCQDGNFTCTGTDGKIQVCSDTECTTGQTCQVRDKYSNTVYPGEVGQVIQGWAGCTIQEPGQSYTTPYSAQNADVSACPWSCMVPAAATGTTDIVGTCVSY